MFKILTTLLLLSITALADDVGRFQLVPAKVLLVTDAGVHSSIDTLIKIDTQTGDTWRYSLVITTNGMQEHWVPVPTDAPAKIP